jgi:hypothetical protein
MMSRDAEYARRVGQMAAALHRDCELEWDAIAVVDPGRMVTMHTADRHLGQAHDLVRRIFPELDSAALGKLDRVPPRMIDGPAGPEVEGAGEAEAVAEAEDARFVRPREPVTVYIVTRKHEIVSVHATHDDAYEDMDRRTGRGARPDLDHIYGVESWHVQDERNLTDEQHAEYVAKGYIPQSRARS